MTTDSAATNGTPTPAVACLNDVEAARYMGVSPHTLRSWRRNGKGPKYIRIEGRILYLQSDLDAYLMEHRVDPRSSLT
jgi:predicted site-specific integrase-resolvase